MVLPDFAVRLKVFSDAFGADRPDFAPHPPAI
jgi:hypothetical protein